MKICSECQRCYDDVVEQCSEWHGQLSPERQGSVSVIAGYRIEERLYSGLRGELFRATRVDCGQSCLIRMIAADEETAKHFLNEAKVVADLYHPNLTAVFECGTTDNGEVFVVSEDPTEGETLRDLLDRGQMELLESIRIVRVVAETLHELHKAGLVFRALNPDNILVSHVGTGEANIRLQNIDLGGAAQHAIMSNKFLIDTETAAIKYFSAEQCADELATARSDVYSLGVLLYELIAGSPPFNADRASGVIEQHRHSRPPEVKIDNFDLRMLVSHSLMESLNKRPEARQSSADLFARQLRHIEQLATHVSTPAPVVRTVPPATRPSPRLITLAESGIDLTEPADVGIGIGTTISPSIVSEPSIVATPSDDQGMSTTARRRVTIQPEAATPSAPGGKIDPESIKQIDFRAARERMKDLLATTPATPPPPKLIHLDEPLDDIPSIDDTLEILRSEGDPSPEFHAAADYPNEISESTDAPHLIESELREPEFPFSTVGLVGSNLDNAESVPVGRAFSSSPASDDEIFASLESFSAVRFARLRRGISIGAAAGLIALAFTFRADIVETFTPFDLGKLEPPPYSSTASSITTSAPQTSEITYTPTDKFEVPETPAVVAEEVPKAVTIRSDPKATEESPVVRKLADKASETKTTKLTLSRPKPETYKPETLVITYPDPKTRKASNDRDPFVKPRSGAGMTRPRIVANPKP